MEREAASTVVNCPNGSSREIPPLICILINRKMLPPVCIIKTLALISVRPAGTHLAIPVPQRSRFGTECQKPQPTITTNTISNDPFILYNEAQRGAANPYNDVYQVRPPYGTAGPLITRRKKRGWIQSRRRRRYSYVARGFKRLQITCHIDRKKMWGKKRGWIEVTWRAAWKVEMWSAWCCSSHSGCQVPGFV